jgi:hypothetical protein
MSRPVSAAVADWIRNIYPNTVGSLVKSLALAARLNYNQSPGAGGFPNMGCSYNANCRACGKQFSADKGGGRHFEQLRCDTCGASKVIGYEQIREPLSKYQHDLDVLDSLDSEEFNRACEAYHRAVETAVDKCSCGGRFSFAAPIRCPECRSSDIDLGKPRRLYD